MFEKREHPGSCHKRAVPFIPRVANPSSAGTTICQPIQEQNNLFQRTLNEIGCHRTADLCQTLMESVEKLVDEEHFCISHMSLWIGFMVRIENIHCIRAKKLFTPVGLMVRPPGHLPTAGRA